MARLVAEFDGRNAERNAARFRKELKRLGINAKVTSGDVRTLNTSFRSLGATLGAGLSVAFLVREMAQAVKAARKLSNEFEESLTKIETLVGVNRQTVQAWRGDILDLSVAAGRSATELSEAQFAITSAGLRGAESLDVLRASAKAAAVGLGEARSIALASVAAITAYGKENISAAQATETLFKTVREGNLEAASLAPTLGRVIGIASELKISFADVNAFIAAVSRFGVPVEEAVTSLSSTLSGFLSTTEQQREAFKTLGTSADEVRKSLGEQGLAATLIDLTRAAGGDTEALGQLIPNVRALRGVLAATGSQAEEYLRIEQSLAEQTNELDKGFARVQETGAFASAQLNAAWEGLLITLGDELAPEVNELARTLTDLAQNQEVIQFFADLGGAIGSVIGFVVNAVSSFVDLRTEIHAALKVGLIGPLALEQNELERELNRINSAMLETQRILSSGAADRAGTRAGLEAKLEALRTQAAPLKSALAELKAQARAFGEQLDSLASSAGGGAAGAGGGGAAGAVLELKGALEEVLDLTSRPGFTSLSESGSGAEAINDRIRAQAELMKEALQDAARIEATLVTDAERLADEWNRAAELWAMGAISLQTLVGYTMQLAKGMQQAGDASSDLSATLNDLAGIAIDFGGLGQGPFAGLGADLGGTLGFAFGGPEGARWGALAGQVIGGLIKEGADEALATVRAVGVQIRAAEGNLGDAIRSFGEGIFRSIRDLVRDLGGSLGPDAFPDIEIKLREGIFTVFIEELVREFESEAAAVDFAVRQALQRADITGISDNVRQVLQNDFESLAELGQALNMVDQIRLQSMEPFQRQLTTLFEGFEATRRKLVELGVSVEELNQGLVLSVQSIRGSILDQARSLAGANANPVQQIVNGFASLREQARQLNAELDAQIAMETARLQSVRAQITGLQAIIQGEVTLFDIRGEFLERMSEFGRGLGLDIPEFAPRELDRDAIDSNIAALEEQAGAIQAFIDSLTGQRIPIGQLGGLEDQALDRIFGDLVRRTNEFTGSGSALVSSMEGVVDTALGLVDEWEALADAGRISAEELASARDAIMGEGFSDQVELARAAQNDLLGGIYSFLGRSEESAHLQFTLEKARLEVAFAELQIAQEKLGLEIAGFQTIADLMGEVRDFTFEDFQRVRNPPTEPLRRVRDSFDSAARDAERIADELRSAKEGIAGFLVELQRGEFGGLTPGQAADTAAAQVRQLIEAAQGGSLSALQQFPEAARDALRLMREAFGSTPRFQEFLEEIQASGLSLLDVTGVSQGNVVFDERLLSQQQAQVAVARESRDELAGIRLELREQRIVLNRVLDDRSRRQGVGK